MADPDGRLERFGDTLRALFTPARGPLAQEHAQTMQAIGKMKDAAQHLRETAARITEQEKPVTDPIMEAINEATEAAVEMHK